LWSCRSLVWRCQQHRELAEVLARRAADVFVVTQQLAWTLVGETSNGLLNDVLSGVEGLQAQQRWEESLAIIEIVESVLDSKPWWAQHADHFRFSMLAGSAADGSADASTARTYFRNARRFAELDENPDWYFQVAIASSGSSQPLDGDRERVAWLRTAFDPATGLQDKYRIEALAEFTYVRGLVALDDEVAAAVVEMQRLSVELTDDKSKAFAAHGTLVTTLSSPDAFARLEQSNEALKWGHAASPEIAVTPFLTKVFSLLQLGRESEAASEVLAIEALVNLRQRSGDRWLVHLIRALLEEWRGDQEFADRHTAMAWDLALRHDIQGGREAWGLFQISRAWRTHDETMMSRFANDHADAVVFQQATRSLFLAWQGDEEKLRAQLRRVVGALETQPKFLGWLGACLLAAEAASIAAPSFIPTLQRLLIPHSGLFVVTGLVPASTFGPVDRVLALMSRSMGDFDEYERLCEGALDQMKRAGLEGWNCSFGQPIFNC
jgi:hypothetical protein